MKLKFLSFNEWIAANPEIAQNEPENWLTCKGCKGDGGLNCTCEDCGDVHQRTCPDCKGEGSVDLRQRKLESLYHDQLNEDRRRAVRAGLI